MLMYVVYTSKQMLIAWWLLGKVVLVAIPPSLDVSKAFHALKLTMNSINQTGQEMDEGLEGIWAESIQSISQINPGKFFLF